MFRLVYRPSAAWALTFALSLFVWIYLVLISFRILERNLAEAIILLVPAGVLAWSVGLFLLGPRTWEVDEGEVRTTFRGRAKRTPLAEVGRVACTRVPGSRNTWLVVSDRRDTAVLEMVDGVAGGAGLTQEDVRAFYDALAYYLRAFGVATTNDFGWRPRAPTVSERRAGWAWVQPEDLRGHLAYSLVTGGLPLIAGFGLGKTWIGAVGVGFVASGIALAVWHLRHREVRPARQ